MDSPATCVPSDDRSREQCTDGDDTGDNKTQDDNSAHELWTVFDDHAITVAVIAGDATGASRADAYAAALTGMLPGHSVEAVAARAEVLVANGLLPPPPPSARKSDQHKIDCPLPGCTTCLASKNGVLIHLNGGRRAGPHNATDRFATPAEWLDLNDLSICPQKGCSKVMRRPFTGADHKFLSESQADLHSATDDDEPAGLCASDPVAAITSLTKREPAEIRQACVCNPEVLPLKAGFVGSRSIGPAAVSAAPLWMGPSDQALYALAAAMTAFAATTARSIELKQSCALRGKADADSGAAMPDPPPSLDVAAPKAWSALEDTTLADAVLASDARNATRRSVCAALVAGGFQRTFEACKHRIMTLVHSGRIPATKTVRRHAVATAIENGARCTVDATCGGSESCALEIEPSKYPLVPVPVPGGEADVSVAAKLAMAAAVIDVPADTAAVPATHLAALATVQADAINADSLFSHVQECVAPCAGAMSNPLLTGQYESASALPISTSDYVEGKFETLPMAAQLLPAAADSSSVSFGSSCVPVVPPVAVVAASSGSGDTGEEEAASLLGKRKHCEPAIQSDERDVASAGVGYDRPPNLGQISALGTGDVPVLGDSKSDDDDNSSVISISSDASDIISNGRPAPKYIAKQPALWIAWAYPTRSRRAPAATAAPSRGSSCSSLGSSRDAASGAMCRKRPRREECPGVVSHLASAGGGVACAAAGAAAAASAAADASINVDSNHGDICCADEDEDTSASMIGPSVDMESRAVATSSHVMSAAAGAGGAEDDQSEPDSDDPSLLAPAHDISDERDDVDAIVILD